MKLTLYQVDAFASALFKGNPAAVIPLDKWLDDSVMQQIAMENNLAETVFFVESAVTNEKGVKADFDIRWFTPELEVNLCGHATLASAYVLFQVLGYEKSPVVFNSKSGFLYVQRVGDEIHLDFPSWNPNRISEFPAEIIEALGNPEVVGMYRYRDLLIELPTEEDVLKIQPDFTRLKKTGEKVIITAPGKTVDFVSRFFAPVAGVDEDAVTGSAHSQLIPFWSYKLDKPVMKALQLSRRGGELYCELHGDRVIMGGKCVFYMKGEIQIDNLAIS